MGLVIIMVSKAEGAIIVLGLVEGKGILRFYPRKRKYSYTIHKSIGFQGIQVVHVFPNKSYQQMYICCYSEISNFEKR